VSTRTSAVAALPGEVKAVVAAGENLANAAKPKLSAVRVRGATFF
jgi:hypothetical protein